MTERVSVNLFLLGSLARIFLDHNWDADDGTGEGVVGTGAGDGVVGTGDDNGLVGTGAGIAINLILFVFMLLLDGVCWLASELMGGREHV